MRDGCSGCWLRWLCAALRCVAQGCRCWWFVHLQTVYGWACVVLCGLTTPAGGPTLNPYKSTQLVHTTALEAWTKLAREVSWPSWHTHPRVSVDWLCYLTQGVMRHAQALIRRYLNHGMNSQCAGCTRAADGRHGRFGSARYIIMCTCICHSARRLHCSTAVDCCLSAAALAASAWLPGARQTHPNTHLPAALV